MNENMYGAEATRVMHNPDAFVGKVVDGVFWAVPEGYVKCAITGKLHKEEDAYISCYVRFAFSREFLSSNGIYVEEADWLSEEGYDIVISTLDRLGVLDQYLGTEKRFP